MESEAQERESASHLIENGNQINHDILSFRQFLSENTAALSQAVNEAQNELSDLKLASNNLKKRIKSTNSNQSSLEDSLSQIENLKNEINNQKLEIDKNLTDISKVIETFSTKREEADSTHTTFVEKQKSANTTMLEIESMAEKILKVHKFLFGDEKDDDEINEQSIEYQINELHKDYQRKVEELGSFIQKQKQEFTNLKKDLTDEIISLLPSAGAAKLASAYYEAKTRYGHEFTSNQLSKGPKEKVLEFVCNISNLKTIFNYITFVLPIILIIWFFTGVEIPKVTDINQLIKDQNFYRFLFYKLMISAPLLFISWFGLNSINLNRRLFEEYNHKQRVMQLYHSFKEEVDNQSNDELRIKLLNIMLNVVKDKPSLAMSEYDKPPIKQLWTSNKNNFPANQNETDNV